MVHSSSGALIDMGENTDASPVEDVIQVISHATRDELMSLKINVASKRLIIALCENDRGRFIKLTDGRARVIVPSDGIPNLRHALSVLAHNLSKEEKAESESAPSDSEPQSGPAPPIPTHAEPKPDMVDSERFLCEGRKFYFDVLQNPRGRFLKITQSSTRRVTLVMPLIIMPPLNRAIDMLMDKVPPDENATDPATVQRFDRTIERVIPMNDGSSTTLNVVQREIRVLGKRVVFESGANRRGSYIKIMENSGSQRMAVILPHSAVPEIIQLLQEAVVDGDPAENLPAPQNAQ